MLILVPLAQFLGQALPICVADSTVEKPIKHNGGKLVCLDKQSPQVLLTEFEKLVISGPFY